MAIWTHKRVRKNESLLFRGFCEYRRLKWLIFVYMWIYLKSESFVKIRLRNNSKLSFVDFALVEVGANSGSVDAFDIELSTFHPILSVLAAVFLIELIGHDVLPKSIVLSIFNIACRKVFFEKSSHNDNNKVFIRYEFL